MSYEQKGVGVYLTVALATFVGYWAVLLGRTDGAALTEVRYVPTLLWTIGISIVGRVLVQVLVEVARPSDSYRVDARDREVVRHGEHVGGIVLAATMVGPFVLALLEADHFWIANAMYAAFVLHAVTSSTVKLIAYRRGV